MSIAAADVARRLRQRQTIGTMAADSVSARTITGPVTEAVAPPLGIADVNDDSTAVAVTTRSITWLVAGRDRSNGNRPTIRVRTIPP